MSETQTENVTPATGDDAVTEIPATEVAETPEVDLSTADGIALALAGAGDAMVREENLPRVLEIVGRIATDGSRLAKSAVSQLRIRKTLAMVAVDLMRLVELPSGLPDWDGTSGGFKLLFDKQIDSFMEAEGTKENKLGKQERKNLLNSIRQHVRRTYLEPAIRAYVWETNAAVQESMPNGIGKDSDTPLFHTAVKREYVRCDLTVPNRYLSPEEIAAKRTQGGPGPGPENPAEVIRAAMAGSAQLAPHWAAAEILQATSGLVERITNLKDEPAYNRPATSDFLARVQYLTDFLVRFIDGKAGTPEAEGVLDLVWSDKDAETVASV